MAAPAPQQQPSPITVYPMNEMNSTIKYNLMYLPIYVSNEDEKMYIAGQPLVQLPPVKPEGFLDSLSHTLSIAGNKINAAVQPVATKVDSAIHVAGNKIAETSSKVASKASEKYHEVKDKYTKKEEKLEDEELPKEEDAPKAEPAPAEPAPQN